MFQISGF